MLLAPAKLEDQIRLHMEEAAKPPAVARPEGEEGEGGGDDEGGKGMDGDEDDEGEGGMLSLAPARQSARSAPPPQGGSARARASPPPGRRGRVRRASPG